MSSVCQFTETQLRDYMRCPIYFYLRHKMRNGLPAPVTMTSLLMRVVHAFCMKLADGKVMSTYDLKRKWDMLIKENRRVINSQHSLQGISLLVKFWRWAANEEILIADVGSPYSLKLSHGDMTVILRGTLGILAVTKDKQIEELCVDFSQKQPDPWMLDSRLSTSIMHVAFHEAYGKNLLGTKTIHVRTGREFRSVRDALSEKRRLAKIVCNVAQSIKDGLWYPHESPMCTTCIARDLCRMWGKEI